MIITLSYHHDPISSSANKKPFVENKTAFAHVIHDEDR